MPYARGVVGGILRQSAAHGKRRLWMVQGERIMKFDVIELTTDYRKSGRFDAKALRRKEKRLLILTQESILCVFAPSRQ